MSLSAHMEAIGRPVAYYPRLAKFFGNVNSAILFSQLFYWQQRCDHKLGVFKTAEEWGDETGLSYREQATARQHLVKRGFLTETNKRLEHRIYFRLEQEVVDAEFGEWNKAQLANDEIDSPERRKRISGNDKSAIGGETKAQSVISTEITAETTAYISSEAPSALPAPAVVAAFAKPEKPARIRAKAKSDDSLDTELQAACKATWKAYSQQYLAQYGALPVRNAKVNANVKQFVQRLGHVEAPAVAEFFVSRVNDAAVVRGMHDFGQLLARSETYRTQWATGQSMTATRAKQIDQSQANFSAADEAMALYLAQKGEKNA